MDEKTLQAVEKRAKAATAAPWRIAGYGGRWDEERDVWDDQWGDVRRIESAANEVICGTCDGCMEIERNDAVFIAAARSDVPALLAEVRRLQKESDEMHERAVNAESAAYAAPSE